MKYLWIILLPCLVFGDTPIKKSESSVIKFYDGDKDEKVLDKYPIVEVGDSVAAKYSPTFTLDLWDGECTFKLDMDSDEKCDLSSAIPVVTSQNESSKVTLTGGNVKQKIFKRSDGDLEWEIVLDSNPSTNAFTFDIETEGLDFFYQDTLMDADSGCFRPDNVIGSYAVYHSSKRHNWTDSLGIKHNYGIGKAFHIFRPQVWDDNADTVWGCIEIDTVLNKITVSVDKVWLEKATYPVTIDPTFGDNSTGATNELIYYMNVCQYTSGSGAGSATIDSITAYIKDDATSSDLGGVLYADDGSNGCGNFVDSTVDNSTTTSNTTAWYSMEMSAENTLSASTKYWLGVITDGACNHRYDSNSGLSEEHWNKTWPPVQPCGNHTWARSDRLYSIYLTYTESGGGGGAWQGQIIQGTIQ